MKIAGNQPPAVDAPDMTLVVLALALLLVGLVAISSASIEYAEWHFQNPWHHSQRHLIYLLAGIIAAVASYRVRTEFWQSTGWWWLFGALALLILVLIPGVGHEVNGSQRWLPLGPFTLQPSEFAKLAVVVYLAGYMVRREHEMRHQWQGFLKPMAVLFATTLLLSRPRHLACCFWQGSRSAILWLWYSVHLALWRCW
jgi:cell division protein FtsW